MSEWGVNKSLKEVAMSEVKIIDTETLEQDTKYEPPLSIGWGVDESIGSKTITSGRTIVPPGGRNQRHYHTNADVAMFIRKGKLRFYFGPDEDIKEYVIGENYFVFCPKGTIHGMENLSKTDTAEIIFTFGNCPSKKAAGTTYVEKPWV